MNFNENKSLVNKLVFSLFLVMVFFMISQFFRKSAPIYTEDSICVFLRQDSARPLTKSTIEDLVTDTTDSYLEKLDIFRFRFDSKQNLDISKMTSEEKKQGENKKKCKKFLENILNGERFCFSFLKNQDENTQISVIRDFFCIKVGTNQNYLEEQKFTSTKDIRLQYFDGDELKMPIKEQMTLYTQEHQPLNPFQYNNLIKEKTTSYSNPTLWLGLKEKTTLLSFKVYIDDSGDLPIQWPSKSKWSYFLGWGYIWNFLIVFIGFFLSFFSSVCSNSQPGYFFGNIGLGIILTTILVRTLLWPIYTKMSSFSMKMSLAQPEINKVQTKYALKKDSATAQQMQMEILKIYRKHNISVLEIFITFVQMPILIAMFRTLKRIFVSGGIFDVNTRFGIVHSEDKPFLGFIRFGLNNADNLVITKILLSFLVGLSMFWLNKINLQKPAYQKQNAQLLNLEQKIKQQQQEKTMKIINYIMILFMTFTAYKEMTMALYWLIGNLYTVGQTLINRQIMKKKYYLLKNQGF
ncbi:YidC/Oxa1 family membrane protein insertase [Candidatus Phytoplasma phoenicium]|uniref:Preprotein translocase subunit YidC n=1 Tax=Candidatus Phytoplasma phoenicium TaxID=198422 RepID=A0A0L0MK05_9MOLU|nr:YidC/Oxa1 family membrane protein insertase [Candidatus Phytoplasma phoenicium]KND62581.1 preprotein translocase subunit YidC [Candidatus Phytoplasma phoenicium]